MCSTCHLGLKKVPRTQGHAETPKSLKKQSCFPHHHIFYSRMDSCNRVERDQCYMDTLVVLKLPYSDCVFVVLSFNYLVFSNKL